ncbi:Gfo/Idh/MocA family protein [Tautonia rosea]|uniref:Gfo/Idh/MocA family protein n=1 Tax=Tautonia rosea TaxID=2728037 RepID=UPI001474DD6F|nr:Gfo/Idh/MocA family oxidoreductase [Tautonia rosea]
MRNGSKSNRRIFLMNSAAAAGAASTVSLTNVAHAAGSDTIRVGVVGCGGRGTGAAEQTLTADEGCRLVAMAELFDDRLESSLQTLKVSRVGDRVDVTDDSKFVGFDAYKAVIDSSDVVLLTTTPHFRPIHAAYAVEKNKHVFVEKPMAVDGPGLRMYLQAVRDAAEKGLSMVHGFCWRYHYPRRATMEQVFGGAIGDIRTIETTYNSQGVWDPRKTREECGSDMEYQQRNWYYYTWLSGDHIVEQAVHGIDTMNWAMRNAQPERVWAVGGRQVRTAERYGNIYDHFSVVYEYPENVRGYHHCRHWPNTANQVKDYILGSTGTCDVFGNRIEGATRWRYRGESNNMYQTEHDEMYEALRAGRPINNGEEAATSTLLAIMGRMAAYTGRVITPDEALNSKERLGPESYEWGDAPNYPIPIPGVTDIA